MCFGIYFTTCYRCHKWNLIPLIMFFVSFVVFSLHCLIWEEGWVHCKVGVMSWFPMSCQTRLSNSWLMVRGFFLLSLQFLLPFLVMHCSTLLIWRQAENLSIRVNSYITLVCLNIQQQAEIWVLITVILLKVALNTITITIVCLLSGLK